MNGGIVLSPSDFDLSESLHLQKPFTLNLSEMYFHRLCLDERVYNFYRGAEYSICSEYQTSLGLFSLIAQIQERYYGYKLTCFYSQF